MRAIVTDPVAWFVCLSVSLSVCLSQYEPVCPSVTVVSPAKTAEPIKIVADSGGGLKEPAYGYLLLRFDHLSLLLHVDGKEFFELLRVVDERGKGRQFVQVFSGCV